MRENVVKAVFYGSAVSVWCSTFLTCFAGFKESETGVVSRLKQEFEVLCSSYETTKILFAVELLIFLSFYFYDEWKSHDPNECCAFSMVGWLLYLVQISLLSTAFIFSIIAGILGTLVVSVGLWKCKNKCWYIAENFVWIITMLCLSCFHWALGIPIIIVMIRLIRFFKKGGEKK